MLLELSEVDKAIARELKKDGRISISDLSQKVNASRPTVSSHLKELREEGLITIKGGFNLVKLGLKMCLIGLTVKPSEKREEVISHLKTNPRVYAVYPVINTYNLMVHIWGENNEELIEIIDGLRSMSDIEIAETICLETPVHGEFCITL
jgi:Lrp/AsnC family transcriptional regulator for asnA, asnC and gidA